MAVLVRSTPVSSPYSPDLSNRLVLQSNLVNMNSTGPSKKVHIKRNFTLTVARCMSGSY